MLNRQNLEKDTLQEIAPAQRVYAFRDLPEDLRRKLFRLQNTDGNFLKTGNRNILAKIIWLGLLVFLLILFIPHYDSSVRLEDRIAFSVISLMLSLWIVYAIWTLSATFTSPLKNRSYLTPTQLVETKDGTIRCRALKNVCEMKISSFRARNQEFYNLRLIFDDGDFYQYNCFARGTANQKETVKKWREKAEAWKNEAVSAFERGDAAYYRTNDVVQKTEMSGVPVRKRKSRKPLIITLLIVTFALPFLGYLVYLLIR